MALTKCELEYGPSTSYGHLAQCEPEAGKIPVDTNPHTVQADLKGLTPGVDYHYRLLAANTEIETAPVPGADATFATGGRVESESAVEVTSTSAVLQATVDERGVAGHGRSVG